MWGNIAGVMGKALETAQKLQNELENQMDAAVGAAVMEPKDSTANSSAIELNVEPITSQTIEITPNSEEVPPFLEISSETNMERSPISTPSKLVQIGEQSSTKTKRVQNKKKVKPPCDVDPVEITPPAIPIDKNSRNDQEQLILELKEEHLSHVANLVAQLEAKHSSHISTLQTHHETKHESTVAELSAQFEEVRSSWEVQQSDMQRHIHTMQANHEESLQTELASQKEESDKKLAQLSAAFETERAHFVEQLAAAEAHHADKILNLQSECEGKVSSLQAQLSATEQGGDQVEAITTEYTKQIDALRATLSQKDDLLAATSTELRNTTNKYDSEVADLRRSHELANESVCVLQAKLDAADAEKNGLAAQKDSAESSLVAELKAQLEVAKQANTASSADLAQIKAQIVQKDVDIATLLGDLAKVKEALAERERALETASKSLSEQHRLNHDYAQKVADLAAEIAEKDARSRQVQSNSAEEEENKKLVGRYQEQLKEQGERLAAFEKEGQSLARKQSEMEKVVRKSKGELKEKDAEIQKLKESKEQLVKAIEQTQDVLKKHEMESTSASKNLTAMQAVSQASTDKLARLEAELTSKTEEFASQRRALEAAWAEATELKRTITELKADRDDLRKRIGEGTSKVMETESSRRDIEKREAVLRATSSQLQDSLQRQMAESALREERLREEVNEMRKRWQEAIGNRESMASELGNVTAPLLRQISSLQESVRVKSEHWQNVESSLSERALRAENAAEIAEHKRSLLEEQQVELKHMHAANSTRLAECQAQLAAAESSIERLKRRETSWLEEKTELDSKFAMEVAQRQSLQSSLREIELRHKVEVQELQDAALLLRNQNDLEMSMCAKDMDLLREELALSKANSGTYGALTASSPLNKNRANNGSKLSLQGMNSRVSPRSNHNSSQDRLHSEGVAGLASDSSDGVAHSYSSTGVDQLVTSSLPNGEVTFAASEKLQQRSRQRDDDMHALTLQIQRLEASRNALLEEVSYLSMRNSQLEEASASVPRLQSEVEAYTKRLELVLVLLGEKEEELEAMMGDMREVKHMYRAHLEELIEKNNPPVTSSGGGSGGSAEPDEVGKAE